MKDEVYFLPADKYQRVLQIDTVILGVWPSIIISLVFLCNNLRKKWVMKLIFYFQISIKVSYKLILWFLMGIAKHSQNSKNSKLVTSLQYLKKQVRDEVDSLHADKHQSFLQVDFNTLGIKVSYKLLQSLSVGMIKRSQSTKSNKFSLSLQHLKRRSWGWSSFFACR